MEFDAVAHGDHDVLAGVGAEVVGLGGGGEFVELIVFGSGEVEAGDLAGGVGLKDVVGVEAGLEAGGGFGGEVDARGAGAFDVEAVAVAEDGEDVFGLVALTVLADVGVKGSGGDVNGGRLLGGERRGAEEGEDEDEGGSARVH